MAQNVVGATAEELRAVRETMRKMLKENGAPPEGRFADLQISGAGARLQGAPRLDHADLRCRGRRDRPDREEARRAGGLSGATTMRPSEALAKHRDKVLRDHRALSGEQSAYLRLGGAGRGYGGERSGHSGGPPWNADLYRSRQVGNRAREPAWACKVDCAERPREFGAAASTRTCGRSESALMDKPGRSIEELLADIVVWGERIGRFIERHDRRRSSLANEILRRWLYRDASSAIGEASGKIVRARAGFDDEHPELELVEAYRDAQSAGAWLLHDRLRQSCGKRPRITFPSWSSACSELDAVRSGDG